MIYRLKVDISRVRPYGDIGFFKNNRKKVTINGDLTILRGQNQDRSEITDKTPIPFLKIEREMDEFRIINCGEQEGNEEELWLELPLSLMPKLSNKTFEIKPNDILKLGEDGHLEVLQIHFEQPSDKRAYTLYSSRSHSFSHPISPSNSPFDPPAESTPQPLFCRICYLEVSESNPINLGITFCECSGSLQYCHLHCMKQWLRKKLKFLFSNEEVLVFESSELSCEICLAEIPLKLLINGTEYQMLDFDDRFHSYVLMRDINTGLITAVNTSNRKQLYIGNGSDPMGCDIIAQGETVEGLHCRLTVEKEHILAEDLGSRYGSFMRVKDIGVSPFIKQYRLQKGDWEFVFRPIKEKGGLFSMMCSLGGVFCGNGLKGQKENTREIVLGE